MARYAGPKSTCACPRAPAQGQKTCRCQKTFMEQASKWVNDASSWGSLPCLSRFCRYMSNWLKFETLKAVICFKKSLFTFCFIFYPMKFALHQVVKVAAFCTDCQVSFSVMFQTLNTFNDFLPFVVIRLSFFDAAGFSMRSWRFPFQMMRWDAVI